MTVSNIEFSSITAKAGSYESKMAVTFSCSSFYRSGYNFVGQQCIKMILKKVNIFNKLFHSEQERTAKLKLNLLGLFFLKGASIIISYLLVPLTIGYLNPSQYGIWLTLSSILMWIDFFDIGLGHGLRNKLAEAIATNNMELGKYYISTTYAFSAVIALVFFLLFAALNPFLNWGSIMNVDAEVGKQLNGIILLSVAFFCIRFVFKLIGIILCSDQKTALDSFIQVLGNIISIIAIYVLTKTTVGSLKYVAFVFSVTMPIVYLLATIYFFRKKYVAFSPSIRYVRKQYFKDLFGLGGKFFIIQLSCLLIFTSANFIIIKLFDAAAVTSYNIAYKYFNIVMMIFMLIATPLWPAFTNAYAQNDLNWIKSVIKKMEYLFVASVGGTILLVLISRQFYHHWVGDTITISWSLTISMAIYTIIYNLLSTYNYVINGAGKVFIQTIHSILAIVFFFPLTFFLCKCLGICGVVVSSTLIQMPLIICSYIQYKKIVSGTAEGIWNK